MKRGRPIALGLFFAGFLLLYGFVILPLLVALPIFFVLTMIDRHTRRFGLGMALIIVAAPIYLAVYLSW